MNWIFSIRYAPEGVRDFYRRAVVGPARLSTVEAALQWARLPEAVRAEIRADATVRLFVEGALSPEETGYYAPQPFPTSRSWIVCIGFVHEVTPLQEVVQMADLSMVRYL
jgi:hypothetical protein